MASGSARQTSADWATAGSATPKVALPSAALLKVLKEIPSLAEKQKACRIQGDLASQRAQHRLETSKRQK